MASITGIGAHLLSGSGLARFIPEPKSGLSTFGKVLSSIGSAVSGAGGSLVGVDSKYTELIQMQIRAQEQMQQVSLVSNLEKSKHETQMAPIRNIRVG